MNRTSLGEVKASPFSLSAALTKDFITPDTILYHGTVGSFDKFDLKAPRNASTPVDEINAVFFSTDKFKAYSHARRKAKVTGEPPVILQAKVNFKNLFDATEPVKKLQKKLKNFGQAKRQIYSAVDKTKYDGIEFRGDNVNDPEYVFFRPEQIKILKDKTITAQDSKETARLKRANQQGYSIDAYKGSPSRVGGPVTDWKGKVLEDLPWKTIEYFQSPNNKYAGFFSSDPKVAERFMLALTKGGASEPSVYPVKIKMKKPLIINVKGNFAASVQFESLAREFKMMDEFNLFKKAFDSNKYDGVILENTKDEATVYIPKNANQVRSRFAQFDPKNKSSKDLLASDKTIEAMIVERKYLTKDDMIKQGAGGHLSRAVKCLIPLDKLDGLEPVPSAAEDNPYVKGKKITNPIEVQYDKLNDVYIVYAGNHRIEQARRNGDKYIPAFVEPDGGKLGLHIKPYNMEAAEPYGYWYTSKGLAKPVKQEDHEAVVLDYLEQDNTRLGAYREWQKETGYNSAVTYALYELGWIRVVTGKTLNVEICIQNVSMKAYVSMRREIPKLDFVNIVFDYSGGDQGTKHDTFDRNQLPAMFKIVRRNVNPELDNNSMIASYASTGEYGYWLEDDGTISPVDYQAHDTFVRKKFKGEVIIGFAQNYAFKKGWIRALNESRGILGIELWYGSVTRGALKALSELINKQNSYKGFIVEIKRGSSPILPEALRQRFFTFKEDEEKKVLHLVRQCLNREITASDDYGYWITNKGDLLKVDHENHNGVADQYIHKHLYKEYLEWVQESGTMDSTEFALTKGFIRLVVEGESLNVEIDKSGISKEAYKTLSNFYNDHYFDRINLDIGFQRTTTTSKRFSAYEDNLNKFLPFVRTYTSKKTMESYDDSEDTFECWITDKAIVPSPFSHVRTLKMILAKKQQYTDLVIKDTPEGFSSNAEAYAYGAKLGWIRIAGQPEHPAVMLYANKLDKNSYKNLYKYFSERVDKDTRVYVDVLDTSKPSYKELPFQKALHLIKENISKDKTILAIDEDNNVTGKYTQIAIEKWQPDDSTDQIQLLNVGEDFIIRSITQSDTSDLTPFKFVETARKALLDRVKDMEKVGVIYKKQADLTLHAEDSYFTDAALKLVKDSSRSDKSRNTLIYMKPSDFLKMAESGFNKDKNQRVIDAGNKNVKFDDVPFLWFENNGDGTATVTGHEGRHRSLFLQSKGDKLMPVMFVSQAGKGPSIRWGVASNPKYEYDYVEVWPKTLIGEGSNSKNRIPFPDSVIYPRDKNMEAADDETIIKRWETTGGKHAITLVQDKYGYAINNFILLPNNEYKKDGTSYLGKADLEQALKKINEQLALYKNVDGSGFKEVRISKVLENVVPKKQAEKAAQITVRGKAQNPLDGFTKFSKQPDFPGVSVYLKKVGSFQYAKVVHDSSNLALISITDKPLTFSPAELVERINVSPLKTVNWLLDQDQLFKKYGPQVLTDMVSKFIASLSMKKQDKTDLELEAGLKTLVKDYIISLYLKRPDAAKNIQKQIDIVIQKKGLNKEKVYFYYGNPAIKSEETWTKVGLVRTGASSPYKYEFADKVKSITEEPVKTVEPTPADKPKGGMVGAYVSGIDKFGNKITGILLTQKTNPRTHKTEGTAVILDDDVPIKAQLKEVRRKLVKPPADLLKAYKIISAKHRLESHDLIATGLSKEELKALNKRRPDPSRGHHSYRLKIGSYCEAKIKRKKQVGFGYGRKFVDHVDTVKGILVKENSYKNGGIASGGLLMLNKVDKETGKQNFVVNEVTGIQPIFRKPPTLLKDHYNKLAKAGKIPGGKEIK